MQKRVQSTKRSELLTLVNSAEAYESNDLGDDLADEKQMEKVEKCLAKKRSQRGRGSFPETHMGMSQRGAAKQRPQTTQALVVS